MEIISNNFLETKELGKKIGKDILGCRKDKSTVLNLKGNLGAGKTTFIQGFALGLGIRKKILSPTFIIFNKYKIKDGYFYHIDCYRIDKEKEMKDLGFDQIINNPKNIVAIEWGEKIKKIMPKNAIDIKFKILKENKRKITYGKRNICSR
ncbi:MAG: tRNA (adenosine(37)-N6)-threonylcarbamoyltransferase complex ATPase subunit type 1 TsaE [Candidatus Microsyncoccus archaeolyticus]|nr:MAG: tRNA (adenosine(37)-N6)-threonylcarbamoyltransferase complex ATPase subunit type 1 TsaE [Candidatus Parcubacteria bacterium]